MKLLSRILLAMALGAPLGAGLMAKDISVSGEIDQQAQKASQLFEEGHSVEARKIYESLLPLLRNRAPSSQLGYVLNGMSKVVAAGGNYKDAIQFAEQAANVYRQMGDAGGESHALNNKAIAELQSGTYAAARSDLEQALGLSRRAHDLENEVQVLNNLGSAYYFPGSYSEALKNYDVAMNLVDQNTQATWSDYWRQITSFNQATLFQRLGRYEKALQIYRQVEKSSKSLTPSDRAHLYANLGALYRRLGDPYKALDIYQAAQRLYSEQHDVGGELAVLKNTGIVYALDMEDLPRAKEIFGSSIELAERTRNRREEMKSHLYLGETLFRMHSSSDARMQFERCRALAGEIGASEEQWKSLYGLGRIEELSGSTTAAEADYREAIGIIEKTRSLLQLSALRLEFFADKREAYDAIIVLLLQKNDTAEAFSFLERSRARNFQDRLQTTSREPGNAFLTIEQARAAIAPETVLMEFWTSGDRVGLIWCTREGSGTVLKQLSQEEMTRIREFLDGMPNILSEPWQERTKVLDTLVPRDANFLHGVRHMVIVPDGWISYIPFDLVHAGPDPNSLLIEDYDISYMPTAALLRRPRPPERRLWFPWTRELSAFGDPTIGPAATTNPPAETENTGAQRLPFSEREILSIAKLIHGRGKVFLQQNDLKKFFLSPSGNNAFLLHVSTHASADGNSPENSRLLFSSETADLGPDYVFLRELYDLNLNGVRLATISACDTERGKIIRGEGVQAFSRALLSAGAASSLTTLWRVDDELTAEFMTQFYYLALNEHKPKAEALRMVKLKFLHSNPQLADPRLWAAFVLNGDGATPLPTVLSWPTLAVIVVVAAATMSLAVSVTLRRRSRIYRKERPSAVVT